MKPLDEVIALLVCHALPLLGSNKKPHVDRFAGADLPGNDNKVDNRI